MNFIRKIGGNGEEEEEEKQTPPTVDRFLASYQPRQQPFFSPPPYRHDGEPSRTYEEEGGVIAVEREHMFDKVVTPSDVGKLNRLVIPKQHAERYFPLDSSSTDKGLLLNFEDMNGKMWRFRYSYWNSSQSYVMTKGWSRFVKEKNLDAGDVVSFQRGVGVSAKDRLFIDWRRRVTAFGQPNLSFSLPHHNHFHPWNPLVLKSHPAVPRRNPNLMPPTPNTSENVNNGGSRSVFYFRPGGGYATQQQHFQMVQMPPRNGFGLGVGMNSLPPPSSATPQLHGKASGKRLRLFGVNMDCPLSEDERDQTYDPPSQTIVAGDYTHGVSRRPPVIPPSSSSSSIPYLQLMSPYGEGNESNQSTTFISSSSHGINIIDKSTTCNMSLDLDI